jgi:AmmeMemoRadiSam system protein A
VRTPSPEYSPDDRGHLIRIARDSLTTTVRTGTPLLPDAADLGPGIAVVRASFVTLRTDGELRGCTGSLEAVAPLGIDVARATSHSALADPRFPPVTDDELQGIRIEISVLSPLEPVPALDEQELLARLEPGVDGLVLALGHRRATFLPKVWEQLPDAAAFVRELRRKAGLPPAFWSSALEVYRYRTETFGEGAAIT